jgi:transcriptional regulator with XRE-family HTH domain
MVIANRIKAIREIKGFSQEYVALKLGIKQQTYSSFETKAGDKSVLKLIKLAQILEVDVCLFFAFKIPINKTTVNLRFSDH